MPHLLVDADPAVSDVARDVSGLRDVTVSGSVSEGCLVLVLRRGECRDSREYMCASNYGTTTKVLDMYPGEVAIAAEYDGPLKHRREVQCSVFATVEITWSWRSRNSADSPWTDITTGLDHNVSDVIPDVIDRCDLAWTSVLSVSQGMSDRRWSFRCCAGYRDVSNVSCATWSPAEPERTSSSSTITTTHSDVNFSLTSSTMTTAANNVIATVDHGTREAILSITNTPVRARPVQPVRERKSTRPTTEIGAVVMVVAVVVTVVTMVVFAVHRAVSGRLHRSNSTPRGLHVMTTTLSQRPLTRHNTITPVDT
ncbi:uncharacterized protein [Littorina saxatilis]|uniref:uncharacterized protein n=1 Tax=Littorina saxatilis TaxID=31220 RepID=UPI0038B53A6E